MLVRSFSIFRLEQPSRLATFVTVGLLLFFYAPATSVAVATNMKGNTHCGAGLDLSALPPVTFDLPQLYLSEENVFTWTVSLCNPVMPGGAGAAACQDPFNVSHPDVLGYVVENRKSVCETAWTTIVSTESLGNGGVQFVFGQRAGIDNHPGWTAVVDVTCGTTPNLQPSSPVVSVSGSVQSLQFNFVLSTSLACADAQPPSFVCGGGCAFLSAILGGSVLYVVGMISFLYCVGGKRGRELLPHAQFWGAFVSLVKEGMVYSWYAVTCRRERGDAYIVRCAKEAQDATRTTHTGEYLELR